MQQGILFIVLHIPLFFGTLYSASRLHLQHFLLCRKTGTVSTTGHIRHKITGLILIKKEIDTWQLFLGAIET